ncbi:hypothetical protein QYE76_027024 [Lolium multiflorum]|uniref:Transposase n=1 Tax=Lolium multiflorum TaxID=4521 RepID=A0AAD8PH93_LOLMU|nr:hypothetical protein QYE76_027024 [Lolium multiflorum]
MKKQSIIVMDQSRKSSEREKIALQQAQEALILKEIVVAKASQATSREDYILDLMTDVSLDMAGSFLDAAAEDQRVDARSDLLVILSLENDSSFWICYPKLDMSDIVEICHAKLRKRKKNVDKINDVVTPVAEKMIDDLIQMDADFFMEGHYADYMGATTEGERSNSSLSPLAFSSPPVAARASLPMNLRRSPCRGEAFHRAKFCGASSRRCFKLSPAEFAALRRRPSSTVRPSPFLLRTFPSCLPQPQESSASDGLSANLARMEIDAGQDQEAGSSSHGSGIDLSKKTRGAWRGSDVTQHEIDWLRRSRRIPEGVSCRLPGDEIEPVLNTGEFVVFLAHFERGFGLPASDFFRQFLNFYQLQPHHLPGNAVFYLSCYVSFMEAYIGIRPTRETFARFFSLRINSVQGKEIPKPKPPVQCGSCIIGSRQGSPFFKFSVLQSCRLWQSTFFYVKNDGAADLINLPAFNPAPPRSATGFNGCVKCMDEPRIYNYQGIPGPRKPCYQVLEGGFAWITRGENAVIYSMECPAPGKKRPKPEPLLGVWKARSVFHDLEYWKVLHTPHSLDVMHITKNVTESLLGTLCNSEKSKDGPKARYDLKHFGIRKDLQAPDTDDDDDDDEQTEGTQRLRKRAKKNAVQLPAACFTTSPEELEQFFRCLLGVKVPHGYSGNISRYLDVAKKRFTGMKSHDCHVLMTQILPVAIRGIMDEHVRDTLFGLCNFFDVITRKSIGVRQLKMLQDEIVVILCELEIYFPPAFCDICVHLLLHVVEDIKQLGPTFLHNMMPFERQNGVMKGYVRNRARPDASMAKGFLTYECISFCQNYLSTEDDEDHVGLPPRTHLGRLAGVGHREGYRSVHVGIENRRDDFDRAHRVALQHLKLTEPFVQEHKSMVEQNYIDMGRPRKMGDVTKKHNSSFTRWFKQTQLVEAQRNTPSTEDEKLIYTLSQGPAQNLRTYQGYDINGYRFYTEEKDRNSENQNSGVTMLSYADDETNVKERFFGRIEEIWELNYCGETVPMFRVRWAKKVEKEGRYFTTMVIPDAKSKNASAKNEPWVLGSQVDQCFFITDPSRPSRVVVRRGKRSIIGMQGDANEEDLDKNGDPKMEEEFDRHFDMPTTSKRRHHRLEPPPSAAAAEEEDARAATATEEEEDARAAAATEEEEDARAAAATEEEEDARAAAATEEEEDTRAAVAEEEEDSATTTA